MRNGLFLFYGFSSSSNTRGTPLGTVRCCEGRTTVVARKENLDRVCKRESKLPGPKNPKGKFWPCVQVKCTDWDRARNKDRYNDKNRGWDNENEEDNEIQKNNCLPFNVRPIQRKKLAVVNRESHTPFSLFSLDSRFDRFFRGRAQVPMDSWPHLNNKKPLHPRQEYSNKHQNTFHSTFFYHQLFFSLHSENKLKGLISAKPYFTSIEAYSGDRTFFIIAN